MLFSEPKIPQYCSRVPRRWLRCVSVLFSEPKIPQSGAAPEIATPVETFQCSSASRKFLNRRVAHDGVAAVAVSVLFSEPKIPQSDRRRIGTASRTSFSALQRAENSSIETASRTGEQQYSFQCSSASRKFLNWNHKRWSRIA